MTVSEAITKSGITPSASYTGIETANDFVLAFQIESTQTKESQWIVCADHVKEHSGSLNATTEDAQYIRTGNVTEKTGTQRTLAVNGDRCVGDAFQDFVLSHKIVYGTGSDIIVPYIYFSLRTGKGEKGSAAIIVTTDVGGAAGSKATFACDVKAIGTPSGRCANFPLFIARAQAEAILNRYSSCVSKPLPVSTCTLVKPAALMAAAASSKPKVRLLMS